MHEESKNLIVRNFVTLMKECDVVILKKLMVEKAVFLQNELDNIFSTDDPIHNKRVFFFNIQKKEERAFTVLIQCLRQTKQNSIADLLQPVKSDKVFHEMYPDDDTDDDSDSIHQIPLQYTSRRRQLVVKVQPSETFYDTPQYNLYLEYYSTRSKKRGRLLIINNFDFISQKHPYRNGADVDNANIVALFKQMGGWDIQVKNNITAAEMEVVIKDFTADKTNSQYDICFAIIMSHGSEKKNDTIISGIDNKYISSSFVVKQFENCKTWRHKPKVIFFQVCRGEELDISIRHTTETDSMVKGKEPELPPKHFPIVSNIRSLQDLVVCYSTSLGYRSHRTPDRGSWYIEILCEKFMNFAHNTSLEQILMMVDQALSKRMSEYKSMQTSEHIFRGFNKLYLHPGIYYEDDTRKNFFT